MSQWPISAQIRLKSTHICYYCHLLPDSDFIFLPVLLNLWVWVPFLNRSKSNSLLQFCMNKSIFFPISNEDLIGEKIIIKHWHKIGDIRIFYRKWLCSLKSERILGYFLRNRIFSSTNLIFWKIIVRENMRNCVLKIDFGSELNLF